MDFTAWIIGGLCAVVLIGAVVTVMSSLVIAGRSDRVTAEWLRNLDERGNMRAAWAAFLALLAVIGTALLWIFWIWYRYGGWVP